MFNHGNNMVTLRSKHRNVMAILGVDVKRVAGHQWLECNESLRNSGEICHHGPGAGRTGGEERMEWTPHIAACHFSIEALPNSLA